MEIEYFSLFSGPHRDEKKLARIKLDSASPEIVISLKAAGNMGPSDDFGNGRRLEFFRELSLDSERVASLRQEHTKTVVRAGDPLSFHVGAEIIGDGLISGDPYWVLGVTVADCLPLFLYHPGGKSFAAVHSGWKGTGIAETAAHMLAADCAVPLSEMRAVIGPGIGPCCYAVDRSRAEYFRNEFGGNTVIIETGRENNRKTSSRYRLDLKQANINLLGDAGIADVRVCTDCTCCRPELGSFRREGPDTFTRMIALIGYL